MAHHAEPMDIDDEGDFDNKENTYQHSNVLPKTPNTEKGYEELDVSELNMKLRYSITPAASPMSKSTSHCLDHRQNTLTDESLNNTVINEYENNLTRSLNSTLNKTEIKSSKVLPLQALSTTDSEGNRSSVLRSLDSAAGNDVTITVGNENDIDNLSFPSSSSSMAQTPEATTPTKEIPKLDGGSPIMRGLKSVLSMFRSSQSPIPPEEEDPKATPPAVSPADVPLPESKPRAIASTPKSENNKEKSLSRRNSPHKESIVFNEDLEKELQWNDDSTIVFSSEKIPIHKLFFQDKPSKSTILNENVKQEDANSTVEYMDVSYNDLSIKDKTLNGTVCAESDGEFVDCETTFTQNETHSKAELDAIKTNDSQIANVPEKQSVEHTTVVKEPFVLDTTKDIINSIDASNTTNIAYDGDLEKPLDYSTTDIVNQLSDLINESETSVTNVISIENKDPVVIDKHETFNVSDVQTTNNDPELLENQVTSPDNIVTDPSSALTNQVSNENENLAHTAGIVCHTILPQIVSVEPKFSLVPVDAGAEATHASKICFTPVDADAETTQESKTSVTLVVENKESKISLALIDAAAQITHEIAPQTPISNETEISKTVEHESKNFTGYPSPVDIPLPNDDDVNDINDNLDKNVSTEFQNKVTINASASQNGLMADLNNPISQEIPDAGHSMPVKQQNKVIDCLPHLLSSDVPLPNQNIDLVKTSAPHEAITEAFDPVHSPVIDKSVIGESNVLNDTVNIPITKMTVDAEQELKIETVDRCPTSVSPNDVPLPGMNDDNRIETQDLAQEAVVVEGVSVDTIENHDNISIKDKTMTNNTSIKSIKSIDIGQIENNIADIAVVHTTPRDLVKPEDEHMEISFVESNNDKHSETTTMDVSMVDANVEVEDTFRQSQFGLKDIRSVDVVPELPEIVNDNVNGNAKNVSKNKQNFPISNNFNLESQKIIEDSINNKMVLETATNKTLDVKEFTCENAALPQMVVSEIETIVADDYNAAKVVDSNKHDDPTPLVSDIVSDLNTTSAAVVTVPNVPKVIETSVGEDITAPQHRSKEADTAVNEDFTCKAENPIVKNDEEIILSESNSPFVSMSAEEEFEPESKKDDFEKIDNPFSTKSKVAQSPPISPKIVSKGYNFNFDDIDNINPFATKTKIRMSPPPDSSPNNSVMDKLNKTEIIEPVKSKKDVNRRKSMPERKKPLKAKRHLNSSVDNTVIASPKTNPSKNDGKTNDEQNEDSRQEINQKEISEIVPLKEEPNYDKTEVAIASEIIIYEEKINREPAPAHIIVDSLKDESARTEGETSENGISPVIQDTSSSEQSTYFSAGASSAELTESKNVFNLPELDASNPFTSKSKIRQSPSRDFDSDDPFATKTKIKSSPETSLIVTQKDCNSTATIDTQEDLKAADCSGSSKMSDEKDVTVQEVHTEDEDTLEGPFLEADDVNDCDDIPKLPDDKLDVVGFDNTNQQENDDAAEMFIDAEAFEFLMNQNKTEEVTYSGKESLFLKFDPLFARRVTSEGVAAALNDIKRKHNTPKKAPNQVSPKEVELLSYEKPVAGPSDLNGTYVAKSEVEERSEDLNVTSSKPMMAVTPAINPVVTPRKSLTPNKTNRLSMTFTSPAMAVIDRLLSLSSNSSGLDTTVTHADRSHNETDQALTQLRELLAEKEIHVYNLRCETKELKDRLTTLETQMKALETESAERLKKVNDLNENLAEKTKMNRNMAAVVEEYERTIASLISETEQDKKRFAEEREQLIRDRDEQTAHLASMEVSFNDLHSKYEKSKQVIIGYKNNEEAYKKSIQGFEENLAKMHSNYELLKQHATSKLNHANQELEKINKAHEGEILKFNAMLKRKEVHITSLEESLAQKTKANEELTAICDELINKVG